MFQKLRIILLMFIDAILVNVALYGALLLRFDGNIPVQYISSYYSLAINFTVIRIGCYYFFGLYKRLWKYASIEELITIINAVTVGTAINISYIFFVMGGELTLPRGVFILSWMLNIVLIGGSRLGWRLVRDYGLNLNTPKGGLPVLIVGAGDGGVLVARELKNHYNGRINIVGFIDDDDAKQKVKIMGIPVLGNRSNIVSLVETYNIQEIILAIPSAEGSVIREIVTICKKTDAKIKILPGMYDLIDGKVSVSKIREVQVEDLLGREPVKVDLDSICQYVSDQVVLVTGAGGSIGSELCRQVANYAPKKLLLLDVCENNVYDIEMELKKTKPDVDIYPLVKDVRDYQAIEDIFKIFKPQVVFHAAAHKHVPLMEANPEEAIKNNVMGTYHVAKAADLFGAKKFVLISTDKAVNPTSVMGASKRVAEMVLQHLDNISETNYAAVRFGNVLGSRGSVLPLFKKQIAEGGPVTVTHEDMIRYFMTIPEAVQLVIQAGAMAQGGEKFILDMGEPVKIMDLAKSLIELSGFEPVKDIEIAVTGMRPGEKLFEELLTDEEGVNSTTHKRIFVAKPGSLDVSLIQETINNIEQKDLPVNEYETERFLQSFLPDFRVKQCGKAANA